EGVERRQRRGRIVRELFAQVEAREDLQRMYTRGPGRKDTGSNETIRLRRAHPLHPDRRSTARYSNDAHCAEGETADTLACCNFNLKLHEHLLVSAFLVPSPREGKERKRRNALLYAVAARFHTRGEGALVLLPVRLLLLLCGLLLHCLLLLALPL